MTKNAQTTQFFLSDRASEPPLVSLSRSNLGVGEGSVNTRGAVKDLGGLFAPTVTFVGAIGEAWISNGSFLGTFGPPSEGANGAAGEAAY